MKFRLTAFLNKTFLTRAVMGRGRMLWTLLAFALVFGAPVLPLERAEASSAEVTGVCSPLLDFRKRYLADDKSVRLCDVFAGKVVLVVNTASKCAFTPQYDGLEALYERYRDRGLVVVGFPSNDFGAQEPGSEKTIQSFCRLTYAVDFPMFEKTAVRQGGADPIYQALAEAAGEWPRWNFHKYLIGRDGKLIGSYPSHVAPADADLVRAIIKAL